MTGFRQESQGHDKDLPYATIAKLSITVGEINATLKLWTFGYCLYLPKIVQMPF